MRACRCLMFRAGQARQQSSTWGDQYHAQHSYPEASNQGPRVADVLLDEVALVRKAAWDFHVHTPGQVAPGLQLWFCLSSCSRRDGGGVASSIGHETHQLCIISSRLAAGIPRFKNILSRPQ